MFLPILGVMRLFILALLSRGRFFFLICVPFTALSYLIALAETPRMVFSMNVGSVDALPYSQSQEESVHSSITIKFFSCLFGVDSLPHMVFLHTVNMVDYIGQCLSHEPALLSWGNSTRLQFIISFYIGRLNFLVFCQDFCVCVHEGYWFLAFFLLELALSLVLVSG